MTNGVDAFKLDGRVALVTGGGSGIGQACAVLFAQAGADVVLFDVDARGMQETVDSIRVTGRKVMAVHGDVARESDVAGAVAVAVEQLGRLDVMANIAGYAIDCPIMDMTDEIFDRLYAVHLKGTLYGIKHALRAMVAANRGGSIINCSSSAIDRPRAGLGGYAAMKAAIASLTRVAAIEGGKHNIRCNSLAPGLAITKLTQRHGLNEHGVFEQARLDAWLEGIKAKMPLDLVGNAGDVAYCALFLATDPGRYLTGQVIRPNGGLHMAP
jgi:3-oxoacyl-[acyl-carrier protein] reductase